jgi:hypothetical protein
MNIEPRDGGLWLGSTDELLWREPICLRSNVIDPREEMLDLPKVVPVRLDE